MSTAATRSQFRTPEYWLALIAICVFSVCFYGLRAALLLALAVISAVLTDFFCLFLQNKPYGKADLSNVATAIILVLMFPATIPYRVVIISTVFAIAVGIHVFGSRGNYLFPPAAVGYLFALLWQKDAVLLAPQAGVYPPLFGGQETIVQSTISSKFNAEGLLPTGVFDLLIGNVVSPMGTGCLLLLAVIFLILLLRSSVSYWGCAGYLCGISILSVFGTIPSVYYLTVNMTVFSMIFLVSEPQISPKGRLSVLIGSMLTGMLTYYLVTVHVLEFAPVVAVMLTCPLWHLLADFEEHIMQRLDAMERDAQTELQECLTTEAEVPHEAE